MAKYNSRFSSLAAGARVFRQALSRYRSGKRTNRSKSTARRTNKRRKIARSVTKSRRRAQKYAQRDITTTSQSAFVYANGRRRLLRKGQAKAVYLVNAGTRIDSTTSGVQTYTDLGPLFSYADILAMMNKIPSVSNNSLLMLRGATAKYLFTNQHQSPVKITLYDVIVKRDYDNDTPALSFNTGLSDMSGGTMGANSVGVTPYKSQYFNVFNKVYKVSQIYLDPGASHIHYVKAKVNRVISNEMLSKSPAYYFKRMSAFCLAVAHGLPVNDSVNTSVVTTARVTVDVVTTKIYDYTWDAHSDNSVSQSYVISTGVTEHGIEVMDGAIASFTSA